MKQEVKRGKNNCRGILMSVLTSGPWEITKEVKTCSVVFEDRSCFFDEKGQKG